MGFIRKIKCKNCGYKDAIINEDPEDTLPGKDRITLFSKKTGFIIKILRNDLPKYADIKFPALKYSKEDKAKFEWSNEYRLKDLKCPNCKKKGKFYAIEDVEM